MTMPQIFKHHIVSGLALLLGHFALAEWSYQFVFPPDTSAVFWLPSGLSVALFIRMRFSPQVWLYWLPALFLSELAVTLHHGVPLVTALSWSIVSNVLVLSAVWLSRRIISTPFDFRSLNDVLAFVAITLFAAIPGSILAAIGSMIGYAAPLFESVLSWYSSEVLGILFFAPVVLCFSVPGAKAAGGKKEAIALVATLSFFSLLILLIPSYLWLRLLYFPLIIFSIAWAAIRFGPRGTALALFVGDLMLVGFLGPDIANFPAQFFSTHERFLILQLFLVTIGILMLLLAAALEEQRKAAVSAQAALKVRDDFISVASHELKTPLSSLTMQVQLLNKYIVEGKLAQIEPSRLVKLAEISNRELKRFSSLINDLLDVSRISAGKLSFKPEEINLD